MPAAGLGSRPPSIISSSNSNDEGGFNEPSPEIKAKLRPAYDFESPKHQTRLSQQQQSPTKTHKHHENNDDNIHDHDAEDEADEEAEKPSLNYVDVGYRLNPDGSEAREVFGESELYDTAAKVSDMHKKFHANGFAQETSTVYAIIKPDVLPNVPTDLYYSPKMQQQEKIASPTKTNSGPNSTTTSPNKTATSPPVGVVSPIRRRSSEISIKSTPPMSPGSGASNANSSSNSRSIASIAKGVAPIASLDTNEDFGSSDIPALPERPPPSSSAVHINSVEALDMTDLEYADTSAGEDEEDLMRTIEGDVDLVEDLYIDDKIMQESTSEQSVVVSVTTTTTTSEVINREDSLPDAMTADEAERLLSSR